MEGRCIVCDCATSGPSGVTSSSSWESVQRVARVLQMAVTPFSAHHCVPCAACDHKMAQVEAQLSELRTLYTDASRSYSLLLDVNEQELLYKERQTAKLPTKSVSTQTVNPSTTAATTEEISVTRKPLKTSSPRTVRKVRRYTKRAVVVPPVGQTEEYVCPVCCHGFRMRAAFRRHLKSHTDSSFRCRQCRQTFSGIFDLCEHSKSCTSVRQASDTEQETNDPGPAAKLARRPRKAALSRNRQSAASDMELPEQTSNLQDHIYSEPSEPVGLNDIKLEEDIVIKVVRMETESDEDLQEVDFEALSQSQQEAVTTAESIDSLLLTARPQRRRRRGRPAKPKSAQRHECTVCSKQFTYKQALQRHEKTVHSDEKPYSCGECDLKFKWEQSLKSHRLIHTGERPFVCPICNRAFRSAGTLKQHTFSHDGKKLYECKICEATFTRSMRLKIHMRSHTGERPYQCEECGEGFADPQIFKRHQLNHRGEKPHVCGDCGRAFVMARYLTEHRKAHTGERGYLCAICGAAFANGGRLKRHMEVHFQSKKHKCGSCDKCFSNKEGLRDHMNNHMGIKPHVCKICDKAFTHRSGLTQHKYLHDNMRRFVCPSCNRVFTTPAKLRRHSTIHVRPCKVESPHKTTQVRILENQETCGGDIIVEFAQDIQEKVPAVAAIVEMGDTKQCEETQNSSQALLELMSRDPERHRQIFDPSKGVALKTVPVTAVHHETVPLVSQAQPGHGTRVITIAPLDRSAVMAAQSKDQSVTVTQSLIATTTAQPQDQYASHTQTLIPTTDTQPRDSSVSFTQAFPVTNAPTTDQPGSFTQSLMTATTTQPRDNGASFAPSLISAAATHPGDQSTSVTRSLIPALGMVPVSVPATHEYSVVPTGQNILYQTAAGGVPQQAQVQVLQGVGTGANIGLTIMQIQVPQDQSTVHMHHQ